MNAAPQLNRIAEAMHKCGLEAVMIGNAAAALQGAPVTTVDIDFMFRKSDVNIRKLKAFSRSLEATILRPFYPVSQLYRIVNEDLGLQVDFMAQIDGIKSFASLRARASVLRLGKYELKVAHLDDILKSKRAANRDRDRAVIPVLERTLGEKAKSEKRKKR